MINSPCVYILQSQKNKRYYIGSTINVNRRLHEHNIGKVKATKYLRPLELKFFYPTESIKEARQLEYKLKKLKSRKIIDKIIKNKKISTK